MLETAIIYIILALISFFPIVIWAYIFSYIDDNPLNKKRFFVGVVGGGLSVVPILYMDRIIEILNIKYLNIFYFVSQVKSIISSLEFGVSLSLFILLLAIFSFVFGGGFFNKFNDIIKIYLRNIFVFFIFILFLSISVLVLNFALSGIDLTIGESIVFGDIVFNSLRLIVFYYLIVAFIEESSKHFNFLQSSVLNIKTIKEGVLYAIFVALGFSLIENMLYLYNYYKEIGISRELISMYFLRSVFSVIVHVLSSSVVAYYFSKALILYRLKDLSFPYLKIFSFGLLISILLHLFFDIALTFGFSFVLFMYFIGGYLYVSSIFYRE